MGLRRNSNKYRENLFGFGGSSKPSVTAPVRRGRTGGLSLSEAARAAVKAGKKSRDLSSFDAWLEAKRLDGRSDGVIFRLRDSYKRGVEAAEADERNREYIRDERRRKQEEHRDLMAQRRRTRAEATEERRSSRRGPKKPMQESGYRAMPDEKTIQEGFKRGLSLAEILRQNPGLDLVRLVHERGRAAGAVSGSQSSTAIDKYFADELRGLGKVSASDRKQLRGTFFRGFRETFKANPAAGMVEIHIDGSYWGTSSLSDAEEMVKSLKGKYSVKRRAVGGGGYVWELRSKRRNPAGTAAEVFEEFHGFKPSEVVTVTKTIFHHEHLAAAGKLTHLDIWGIDEVGHTISGFKGALLAFNEDKNQLFVEGGDQSVNLADFGIDSPHELETLGRLTDIGYHTNKTHLGKEGGEAVYIHKFRTVNDGGRHVVIKIARYPDVIYDARNEQLLLSGGSYQILAEGINK